MYGGTTDRREKSAGGLRHARDDVVKSARFVTVILMGVVFFAGPPPLAAQGIGHGQLG